MNGRDLNPKMWVDIHNNGPKIQVAYDGRDRGRSMSVLPPGRKTGTT